MPTTKTNDAAVTFLAGEKTALADLTTAIDKFTADVNAVLAALAYPDDFPAAVSSATRIANSLLSNVSWPKNEINNILNPVAPATMPLA